MRIAVASNGLDVAQHFALCENFNYYTTRSCEIVDSQNVPAQGSSVEEFGKLLSLISADVLICDQITDDEKTILAAVGNLEVVEGKSGNAFQNAQEYMDQR